MAPPRRDPLPSASSSEGEEDDAQQSLTPSSPAHGSSRRVRSTATDAEGGGDEGGAAPLVKASTKRVDKTRGAYAPLTSTGDDVPSSRRSSRRSRQAAGEAAYASEKPNPPQQDYLSAEMYSDDGGGTDQEQDVAARRRKRRIWLAVGAVVVVVLIAAVVGILLYTHKSSSSTSSADAADTLASNLAPNSTASPDSTASINPTSASISDSALVSSSTGGDSLNSASTDIVSADPVETAGSGFASLDSPTSATGLSSGADLLGLSASATDEMMGFASVTDVLGLSATSSLGGPASPATAASTASSSLGTSSTTTSDAPNRGVFDATTIASDSSSYGLDPLSSLSFPTDAITFDPMATNGDGNLVFTFTTSIDLDPAASSAPTAAFSFGDNGAATGAGETFTFSSAESAIATAPPAFITSLTSDGGGATSTSTASAAEASSTSSTASMSRVFNTTAIFYSETDWTGACGEKINEDSYSIALPLALYPDVTSASPLCGETVIVRNPSSGQRLNVTVLDASNRTDYAIFPLAVFEQLGGDEETGELQVQYRFGIGSALAREGLDNDEGGGSGSAGGDGGGTDDKKKEPVANPVELGVAHKSTWTSSYKSSSTSSSRSSKATSSSSTGKTYSGGMATYYSQNNNAGACGDYNSNSAIIVALPSSTYADGKYCGKTVEITRTGSGKTLKAKVADECPTCENSASLDLSLGAYAALGGTEKEGQFEITWQFVD